MRIDFLHFKKSLEMYINFSYRNQTLFFYLILQSKYNSSIYYKYLWINFIVLISPQLQIFFLQYYSTINFLLYIIIFESSYAFKFSKPQNSWIHYKFQPFRNHNINEYIISFCFSMIENYCSLLQKSCYLYMSYNKN